MTRRLQRRPLVGLLLAALLFAACAPAPSGSPAGDAPAAEAPPAQPAATEPAAEEPAADEPATEESATEESATDESAGQESPETEADTPSGLRVFVIVPEESTASYIADEEFFGGALAKYGIGAGTQDTVGSTQAIQGQFTLNWDDLSTPLGDNQFSVDLNTLTSNQRLRDEWLRADGPEFATYPTATFIAERLDNAPTTYTEGEEASFQMVGQLTVRDVTQPTTFDVTASLSGDTVTGIAETVILLTDFGIDPPDFANTLTVKNEMQLRVEFTAREQ